jgi:uncharacterized membrane protein
MALLKLVHLLSVVIWIGGMFFAYMVLRPVAAEVLQPPERLQLWDNVFTRFFKYVWSAIFFILVSGLYMMYLYGSMSAVPGYVHVMLLLGITMLAIFSYVFYAQFKGFTQAVAAKEWLKAGAILATIRKLIATNLSLGIITFAVVEIGRYW